jgi:GT2 family glycosyltransferase
MHRSGTSLVGRLANILGVDLGPEEEMIAAGPENPRGFWENKELKKLNEAVLERMGGSWHSPPIVEPGWEFSSRLDDLREQAAGELRRLGQMSYFGWKDPRNSLTLPFWRTVADIDRSIVVIRHPAQVASSLLARNGFTVEKAGDLWVKYVANALVTATSPLIIDYENVLESPRETVECLLRFLDLPWPDEARLNKAVAACEPELNRAGQTGTDEKGLLFATRLYDALKDEALASDEVILANVAQAWVSTTRSLDLDWMLAAAKAERDDAKRELEESRGQAAQLRADMEALRKSFDEERVRLEANAARAEGERDELRRELEASRRSQEELTGRADVLERSMEQERRRAETAQVRARGAKKQAANEMHKRQSVEYRKQRLEQRRGVRLALAMSVPAKPIFRQIRARRRRTPPAEEGGRGRSSERDSKTSSTRRGRRGQGESSVTGYSREDTAGANAGVECATGTDGVPRPAYANIVVPVHNAVEDVRECLTSVRDNTNLAVHKVIIVDDGSEKSVRTELEWWAFQLNAVLIARDSAGGFGVAANEGIAASWLPAVVLLNSDVVVPARWVEALLECAATDPCVGIVGPWSNAASWQSIPETVDETGGWSKNPDVEAADIRHVNERLQRSSARLYPRVPLVNGFCYLITRKLLNAIGSLDVESFPLGYGEEDDLSIRAADAGFTAAIADDCFVYHAKSKSYSAGRRKEISASSQQTLLNKHGKEKLETKVEHMNYERELVRARALAAQIVLDAESGDSVPGSALRVGWLQPHFREVGGIRRAFEMGSRLFCAGWDVSLIAGNDKVDDAWFAAPVPQKKISDVGNEEFDILIVSDPDVVGLLERIDYRKLVVYHLDAYFNYRREPTDAYYDLAGDVPNLANSAWTAEMVREGKGLGVDEIIPGAVDLCQFAPRPATVEFDVVCYGSKRERKRTWLAEEAARGLSLGKLVKLSERQSDLSWGYSAGRVFVSTSSQEGFNLTCLEAMACGVPVVCTDDGGSRDYVRHGENAVVTDGHDPESVREGVVRVLEDRKLQARLVEAGMQTAREMNWTKMSACLAKFLNGVQ